MSTAILAQTKGFFRVLATADDALGRKRSLQAERRMADVWTDQHGREWRAEADLKSGHPCTPLVPDGFRPPILPPSEFITFGEGRFRREMVINYPKWREHQSALNRQYRDEVRGITMKLFPNSWAQELERGNALVNQEAGSPPYAVEFVAAAEQGNKWVLGLSQKKPAWVTDALLATIPRPARFTVDPIELTEFPDAPEDEADEIAARYDKQLQYLELDDETPTKTAPKARRMRQGDL